MTLLILLHIISFNTDITSNTNKLNELLKKVKAISTKGLTKDLRN